MTSIGPHHAINGFGKADIMWTSGLFFVLLLAAAFSAMWEIRRWALRWGATPEELGRSWPGDELSPAATEISTRAVNISAWSWVLRRLFWMGVFEPAHFTMERKMMLRLRTLAERRACCVGSAGVVSARDTNLGRRAS
jgi:hypothetical protein